MTIPPTLRTPFRCFGSSSPKKEIHLGPKMKIVYQGEEQQVGSIAFTLAIDLKSYKFEKLTIYRVNQNIILRGTKKIWGLFEVSHEIKVFFPKTARICMTSRYPNVLLFKPVADKK